MEWWEQVPPTEPILSEIIFLNAAKREEALRIYLYENCHHLTVTGCNLCPLTSYFHLQNEGCSETYFYVLL
jgi:hypothetical protein